MNRPTDRGSRSARRTPVVGIGASAGGLEALKTFFQHLPPDLGAAYVVIVHLAPDHDSELPSILARETAMQLVQVGDHEQEALQPNQVYVIAPDRKLEVTDASVGASRFEQPRGQRAAIDLFFRSLAASRGDIYAVVLSGGGADGAVGAKAVKEAGGLVLVQDPREAAHDSMPRAVIATGAADVALPIAELPVRLAELIRSREEIAPLIAGAQAEAAPTENEENALREVLDLLRRRTGHDFAKYKRNTVLRRVARRMQLNHAPRIADYAAYLGDNVEEIQALFQDLLITVTTFFRDPEAWTALQQQVIRPLIEQADPDQPIRCWVPGCATGEEAYSLAILLSEEVERQGGRALRDFTVFASDADEAALAVARDALYPGSIRADVSDQRLARWFRSTDDHYRVVTELREHVVFAAHGLQRDPPFSRLHLISCRNLMIYLDRELQDQVMAIFHYACREDGHLFLGTSETAHEQLFRAIDKQHRIYRPVESPGGRRRVLPDLPTGIPQAPPRRDIAPRPQERGAAAESHRAVLEEHAPPSILVDEDWNAIHLSETAGRFLQPRGGPASQAVVELVRGELRGEVSVALRHAFEAREQWLSEFMPVQFNGTPRRVAVLAQPRLRGDQGPTRALVLFLEAGPVVPEDEIERQAHPSSERERTLLERLHQAEQQIKQLRAEHHGAEEDLRAANEELQSLNEEYRSTTEELETSKEELQSINEELQTVNLELKSKLEEVSQAHDDLENLMAATDVATLFLDRSLCIKRFTPQLADIFKVKAHDRGRAIADLAHNLSYDRLEEDVRRVLADLAPIEREASAQDGRSFIIHLRPYRTNEDRIDGVAVTLVDVTRLKRAEAGLRASDRRKDEFLAMLGHELRNPLAAICNSVALAGLGAQPEATRTALAIIERQSRHMTRLVSDLLDVSRITRNKLRLQRRPTDLRQAVEEVIGALKPELESGGLELSYHGPEQALSLDTDPERLAQVLDNLLGNAIKYTEPGGRITVAAEKAGGHASITVRDTGIGIDPDEIETLFEPYRQAGGGDRKAGLGLGLTLAKRLVELHGGTVTAHSEGPGRGSEFTIRLPLATPEQAPATARVADRPLPPQRRILVVDDDADVADSLGALLSALGQQVEVAYAGERGLASALAHRPQIAFLDLSMPGMSGVELSRRLREHFPPEALTLVALSGHDRRAAVAEGGAFEHHLLKPAGIDRVRELLSAIAGSDSE